MAAAAADEYREVLDVTETADLMDPAQRRRTVARLRRELRRIASRDYFSPPEGEVARRAVKALVTDPVNVP